VQKIEKNVGPKMKSEVFPSMKNDKLTRIARNDTLIIAIREWYLIYNIGNKIKRRNYSSNMMRLSARLLQIVRNELQDQAGTRNDCLVRENFEILAKASLLACETNTDDEL
jgi:hypothetical protein